MSQQVGLAHLFADDHEDGVLHGVQSLGVCVCVDTWLLTTTCMVPCVVYEGRSLRWKVS